MGFLKVTKDLVYELMQEIAPFVEEESRLKCNLTNLKIEVDKTRNSTGYDSFFNTLVVQPEFYFGGKSLLKEVISHEIMHNAQFSTFQNLILRNMVLSINPKYNLKNPLEMLIEADATLIGKTIGEKYFKNKSEFMYLEKYILLIDVLKKKFNDGKDRKNINELYIAPIKELEKIFEGKIK